MHELSVTQGILDVALDAAAQAGAQRITRINLVIGTLSSIVDDSVQFYFDIISKGTAAEQATLSFARQQAVLLCDDCGMRSEVSAPLLPYCPQCQSTQLHVTQGREFYVDSIEVAESDDNADDGTAAQDNADPQPAHREHE